MKDRIVKFSGIVLKNAFFAAPDEVSGPWGKAVLYHQEDEYKYLLEYISGSLPWLQTYVMLRLLFGRMLGVCCGELKDPIPPDPCNYSYGALAKISKAICKNNLGAWLAWTTHVSLKSFQPCGNKMLACPFNSTLNCLSEEWTSWTRVYPPMVIWPVGGKRAK